MSRDELKEIIIQVISRLKQPSDGDAPTTACLFDDAPMPGPTTKYGINEEA